MNPIYYRINEEAAKTAKSMYSFSEYRQGSATAEYRAEVDEAYKLADAAVKRSPEQEMDAYNLADAYARKMAEWHNHMFAIECRCPSVMICGPAKFPVNKKEKQVAALNAHMEKLEKIEYLREKIRRIGEGSDVIKSSDANAIDKLREKIENLEALHEHMKAVNVYYRKNKTLKGCELISMEERAEIERWMSITTWADAPFPSFTLRNNLQKIKEAKKRLAGLEAMKDRGNESQTITIEGNEVKVIENTEAMRIQLVFPDVPSAEVRAVLKRHAFRWSSKNSAWQRQLTNSGRWAAKAVIKELTE